MLKVLLVDDEPFIIQGLKVLIDWEQEGYMIAGTASNGKEVIRPAGNHEVNLRILLTILTSGFAAGRLYAIIALEDKYRSQGQSLFRNDNIHIAGIGLNVDVVVDRKSVV